MSGTACNCTGAGTGGAGIINLIWGKGDQHEADRPFVYSMLLAAAVAATVVAALVVVCTAEAVVAAEENEDDDDHPRATAKTVTHDS